MASVTLKLPPSVTGYSEEIEAEYINPGEWFGEKTYLFTLSVGCSARFIIVEAGGDCDALDEYADSEHGAHSRIDPKYLEDYRVEGSPDDAPEYSCSYLGNAGEPHDLEWVGMREIDLRPLFGAIVTHETTFAYASDEPEAGLVETGTDHWSDKTESFYDLERFLSDTSIEEPSDSEFRVGVCYINNNANDGTREFYEKGIRREQSYHLKGFAPEIERWFYEQVTAKR